MFLEYFLKDWETLYDRVTGKQREFPTTPPDLAP